MKIEKFLNKKTSKKTKIEILEKMLKACEAAGGKLPVTDARKIIIKHAEKRSQKNNRRAVEAVEDARTSAQPAGLELYYWPEAG